MAFTTVPTVATGDLWTAANHNAYIRDNFAAGVPDIFTTKGDIAVGSAADAAGRLGVGSNGQVLIADSAQALGVKWGLSPALDVIQAKGDMLIGSAADAAGRLPVGTDGYFLQTDSAETLGVKWAMDPLLALIQAKGDLLVGTSAYTIVRLPVGSNGYLLSADDTQSAGLVWAAPPTSSTAFARCKVSASQSLANNTATIIDFASKDFDPDTAVTTGSSWKYTCPTGKAGYYIVCASLLIDYPGSWNAGERAELRLYKNGSQYAVLDGFTMQAAASYYVGLSGISIINLAAGDYIDIRLWQDSGASAQHNGDGSYTHVSIARLF